MEWIVGWGIVIMTAVSCHRVQDTGFHIHLSSSREAFMQAFKSCICSFGFYLHHSFDSLQSIITLVHTLACWIQGVQSYWFKGVHTELTDARGGVTRYI